MTIARDQWGIPHIRADDPQSAWFGLGYAAATDRLWQMEWDRRRAAGRWAEVVGKRALKADVLARRLGLTESAHADVAAMSHGTRDAFEACTAGINAYLAEAALPPEFAVAGIEPEPWQAWHLVVAFKIRHVMMGTWQAKVAQGRLLAEIGAEAYARLDVAPPPGSPVIVPPSAQVAALFGRAADDIIEAAPIVGFLVDADAGSNSWAVAGQRTATGSAILCNDSHRLLEVPNVYWQAIVDCDVFQVAGATLPGLPGFPHFGHNGRVAWSITHAMADQQDLYVERFDPSDRGRYAVPDGWAQADHRREVIGVRDAEPREIDLWRTRHGPVVHGDPDRRFALSLRYTATDTACRQWEALTPMLFSTSVAELIESQRGWVDPVNNLVCADVRGSIGYLTRGAIPIRTSRAHRGLPAAGWDGSNEWDGFVPFEVMPQQIDPPEGYIATANQAIALGDEPYISYSFAEPFRAERIVEVLTRTERMDADAAAALQADVTSTAARRWLRVLETAGPFDGDAERGRAMLVGWTGELRADSAPALLYGAFRRTVARVLFEPVIGPAAWRWLMEGALPAHHSIVRRWLGNVVARLGTGAPPPDGSDWDRVLERALAGAWRTAVALAGDDPEAWRWGDVHRLAARHELSALVPSRADELDAPPLPQGGDEDTVRCAGYTFVDDGEFDVALLAVYRQVVDLGDVERASWIIPGGASGVPGSEHARDQLELWARAERIPIRSGVSS